MPGDTPGWYIPGDTPGWYMPGDTPGWYMPGEYMFGKPVWYMLNEELAWFLFCVLRVVPCALGEERLRGETRAAAPVVMGE